MEAEVDKVAVWEEAKEEVTEYESPNEDEETVCPNGFRIRNESVEYEKQDKEGNTEWVRVASKIEVIAQTRDDSSNNWGKLIRLKDGDGIEHQWAMPSEMLKGSGEDIRGNLLSMGADIEPGSTCQRELSRYIQLSKPAKRARCVSKTGWCDGVFVLPDRNYGESNELIIYQSESFPPKLLQTSGTLEEWQRNIARPAEGNTRVVAAICKAFSAPLQKLVGADNSGIHFRGDSSIGKTITLKVAASVFGKPSEYVKTWRGTTNGIEATALLHNDLPLILDELAQVSPFEAGDTVYTLMNGIKKQRATKTGNARQPDQWNTALISSGEISLSQHMREANKTTRAGQEVRLVDIPANTGKHGVFDSLNGFIDGAALADHLKESTSKFFGTAGDKFLVSLVSEPERWRTKAEEIMREFEIAYTQLPSQARRVVKQFGLMAAAGEIATEMGITGWSSGEATAASNECLGVWLEQQGDFENLDEQKMIEQVKSFISTQDKRFERFIAGTGYTKTTAHNRAGFAQVAPGAFDESCEDIEEYLIFQNVYKNEICRGYDQASMNRLLIGQGILKPDSSGKSSTARKLPKIKNKMRVYVIDSEKLFNTED